MPRYFFYARGPNRLVPDNASIILDSSKAAYDAAAQTILDMVNDSSAVRDLTEWVIEIRDETGQTLLTVPFSEAIQTPRSGRA
jgi:hypothetical protein